MANYDNISLKEAKERAVSLELAQETAVARYGFAEETRPVVKELYELGVNTPLKLDLFLDTFYVARHGVWQKLRHFTDAIAKHFSPDEINGMSVTAYETFIDTLEEIVGLRDDYAEFGLVSDKEMLSYDEAIRVTNGLGVSRTTELLRRIQTLGGDHKQRDAYSWQTLERLIKESEETGHDPESILDSWSKNRQEYWDGTGENEAGVPEETEGLTGYKIGAGEGCMGRLSDAEIAEINEAELVKILVREEEK
tara:strand:+ start:3642 stop:4397 length:756 start_codon:yes stop_codon:yes gene_type:complete